MAHPVAGPPSRTQRPFQFIRLESAPPPRKDPRRTRWHGARRSRASVPGCLACLSHGSAGLGGSAVRRLGHERQGPSAAMRETRRSNDRAADCCISSATVVGRRRVTLLLISPGVFDRLAVPRVVRTEGEKLQAILSGLERPRRRGRYAYGVQRTDVEELVVELDPAAIASHTEQRSQRQLEHYRVCLNAIAATSDRRDPSDRGSRARSLWTRPEVSPVSEEGAGRRSYAARWDARLVTGPGESSRRPRSGAAESVGGCL
jgi:hypothetical protein